MSFLKDRKIGIDQENGDQLVGEYNLVDSNGKSHLDDKEIQIMLGCIGLMCAAILYLLGIGDWGFGCWGLGPTPKSPIPNPQSPILFSLAY